MAKVPGFAKALPAAVAHRRNGHQDTFANAAEFFNSLLVGAGVRRHVSQKSSLILACLITSSNRTA